MTGHDWLTLAEVALLLPRGRRGAPVHPATVLRWILAGCRAVDGRRLKLPAVRCGCRWLVAREALDQFFAGLAGAHAAPLLPRSPAQRERADRAARRELGQIGL